MTPIAVLLVLASALAHASWNLLAKRSSGSLNFAWGMCLVGTACSLPIALMSAALAPIPIAGLPYLIGTGLLHTLYFGALSRAYANGDLSLVYPLSRGLGVLLVVPGGALVLGEVVSAQAAVGAVVIVVGITVVHRLPGFTPALSPMRGERGPAAFGYAALTGLVIAGYSLLDKVGVGLVAPPVYLLAVFLGPALGLAPLALAKRSAVRAEWQSGRTAILAAGILSPLAYLMVLFALSLSRVSYLAPLREVGLVVGAVMGMLLLGEPLRGHRLVGVSLIAGGVIAIALAP